MQHSRRRMRQELGGPEPCPPSALAGLFAPLPHLIAGGGDVRLQIDPATGVNQYGCSPSPTPEILTFASSTASSISPRAYARLDEAREALMRCALDVGFEEAFELRLEEMRAGLKACLGLAATDVEVVFSPSGTDSQLHALFAVRALLGAPLTTIVVGADQTGSGTAQTALGRHFSVSTAGGRAVRKGEPIAGLADDVATRSVALLDAAGEPRRRAEVEHEVLEAVAAAVTAGRKVLLQVMDASKFGWRAPGDGCLEEVAALWPRQVQVAIDACQLRLGRARLARHLARGHIVIVTGSKYFTGPGFSGALLVPARLAARLGQTAAVPEEFGTYSSRSDWPRRLQSLRAALPARFNFGQWLRWEAALEEMRAYYAVPDAFRATALAEFARAVEAMLAASPMFEAVPSFPITRDSDDEEFVAPTIFPFLLRPDGHLLSAEDCTRIYRALAADLSGEEGAAACAGQRCLIGQPVTVGTPSGRATAALRICASARLVRELWSPDAARARENFGRAIADIGIVVAKIAWLLADPARSDIRKSPHGA